MCRGSQKRSLLSGLIGALKACARNDKGAVAVMFGLAFPVVAVLSFFAIDYSRASMAKQTLQEALDAAALFAARSTASTTNDVDAFGDAAFAAEMPANSIIQGVSLDQSGRISNVSFVLGATTITATASAQVPSLLAGVYLSPTVTLHSTTEVVRSSNNIEVALVLDNTGSMAGQRIQDLKEAAADLVDIVVQDVQAPFYTKVAIAPYSMGVNVGAYAQQVRGSFSGGACNSPGCQSYKFTNPSGSLKTFAISNCVSERTGANAFTDAAPSTTLLGRNYASTNNPCSSAVIMPLSSDKTALKASISGLSAGGSTGGHIGVGWGWYLVSPNFSYLWPTASQPAAYGTDKLLKVVVIMTDGEYNSVYCNGVIAKDSTTGSGATTDHINCNAPNGDSYLQAQTLCNNMKAAGVIVYTVGFDVINTVKAQNLVANCATDAQHVYLPATGSDLKLAFHAIAEDIRNLRISR